MLGSREITLGHLAISPIGKSLDVYIKMFSYEVSSQYMNVINVPTSWDHSLPIKIMGIEKIITNWAFNVTFDYSLFNDQQ